MLTITDQQVKMLDAIPLNIFLDKVVRFILAEAADRARLIPDLKLFIQEQHAAAKAAGCKTEREIVQYIADKLPKPE